MLELPMITRVGAVSPDYNAVYTTGLVPVQIEVQTADGSALLNLSQAAAADLAERLATYLRVRGSRGQRNVRPWGRRLGVIVGARESIGAQLVQDGQRRIEERIEDAEAGSGCAASFAELEARTAIEATVHRVGGRLRTRIGAYGCLTASSVAGRVGRI